MKFSANAASKNSLKLILLVFHFTESTMLVCPNCRAAMAVSSCPCCTVPHFPLPYVCRHWLQVPRPASTAICSHHHQQQQPIPQQELSVSFQFRNSWSGGGLVSQPVAAVKTSSRSSPDQLILPEDFLVVVGDSWTAEDDLKTLLRTKEALDASGWYYGSMTWQEAASRLASSSVGTFLVRDSSSSRCPYALSVQTIHGPTSIRIQYEKGHFWLDCDRKGVTDQMTGVVDLIEHYRERPKGERYFDKSLGKHVWLDCRGKVFDHITLLKPLIKEPPSLQHLCRLTINRSPSVKQSPAVQDQLPSAIKNYVEKYPHKLWWSLLVNLKLIYGANYHCLIYRSIIAKTPPL